MNDPAPLPGGKPAAAGSPKPTLEPFCDSLKVPAPLPPNPGAAGEDRYRICMRQAKARLHRDLCETTIWGYEGTTPGPLIEAHADRKVVVEWVNDIQASGYPFNEAVDNPTDANRFPQDSPGASPNATINDLSKIPVRTVVHLHGGRTPPESDGWPDNVTFPDQPDPSAISTYPGQARGCMLWYHDHANMYTRYNIYAGLAGIFLVRDDRELELAKTAGLPIGRPYEVPLVIQDRNLNLDSQGRFDGQLLYKLAGDGAEFYAPYTLVNGTIWPYLEVEPRPYRLRILNGSNARIYRLLVKRPDGSQPTGADLIQIGGDGGLFSEAVQLVSPAVEDEGLTLAPAERADIILDFAPYAGKNVALVNLEAVPMQPIPDPNAPPNPDPCDEGPANVDHSPPEDLWWVVQFRVAERAAPAPPLNLPKVLSTFETLQPEPTTPLRQILLFEKPPGTLLINNRRFEETVQETPVVNTVEVWEFYNLTGDVHPMHVHLVDFQVIERRSIGFVTSRMDFCKNDYPNWQPPMNATFGGAQQLPPGVQLAGGPMSIDANVRGVPKDTVRVGPMERVRIIAKFGPYSGRHVYHCHVLDHEDMEMMRPFLVLPPGPMPLMIPKCLSREDM